MTKLVTSATLALSLLAAIPTASLSGQELSRSRYAAARDYAKLEKEVAAYEAADRQKPPPKGGILFIGSSTIRLWKTLADDFPDHRVINRGFGGTEIVDSTHFADRLIFPHEPKQIFLRAGGNDIHAGRLPREVAADFAQFVRVVHARLPKTEILYIALSPAPARWGEADKNRELNRLIRADRPGYATSRLCRCIRHQPHCGRPCPPRAVHQGQAPFRRRGLQAARGPRSSLPCAIRNRARPGLPKTKPMGHPVNLPTRPSQKTTRIFSELVTMRKYRSIAIGENTVGSNAKRSWWSFALGGLIWGMILGGTFAGTDYLLPRDEPS